MANKIYDIAIIGAGPAGMTAAIYAGRANKTVAIIDKNGFGGNIANSPKVENIPGFKSISGTDFASKMYKQMSSYVNVEHFINEAVLISYKDRLIIVSLDDRTLVCCKSLIIATGTERKKFDLPTKNIYYCATCDGPMFKDKDVIVVGSGNSGAAYALELANYCKKVYLCDLTFDMLCEETTKQKILKNKKIQWLPNCTIESVTNDANKQLSKVKLSTQDELSVNAIFAAIGMVPNTKFAAKFIEFDNGYLVTNNNMASTLVPGVFAAGDCRVKTVRQVTTAVNDGAIAAINAIKFVDNM